jgi:hypothetical protein
LVSAWSWTTTKPAAASFLIAAWPRPLLPITATVINALSTAVPRELARISYLSSPGLSGARDTLIARAAEQVSFVIPSTFLSLEQQPSGSLPDQNQDSIWTHIRSCLRSVRVQNTVAFGYSAAMMAEPADGDPLVE